MRPRTLAVLLAFALVTVWALGRSTSVQSERQAIAEQAQLNAQVAHRGFREARKLVAPALARTDSVTKTVRFRDETLGTQLDAARAVLSDANATNISLRATLAATVTQAETFRVAVDSLTVVHAAERRVLLAALTSAEVALDAEQKASAAWRKASECRIVFGIKCPTRTQVAVGSLLVGAAAGIYLVSR